MEDKTAIVVSGVWCITLIELLALAKGIDGVYLSSVVGAICTLVGGAIGLKISQKNNEEKE